MSIGKAAKIYTIFCAYCALFLVYIRANSAAIKKSAGVIPPRFLLSIPVYICKKYSAQALLASLAHRRQALL